MDMTEQFLMEQSPQYDNFWGSLMQGKMPQRTDNKPAAAPTPPPQQQASLMQTAMQPEVQQAAAQALGPEKYQQLEQQGAKAGMQQIQQNPQLVPQQGPRPEANNNWYDQILYTPSSITAYNDRVADSQDKWDNTAAANKFANTMDPNSPYAKFANMPGEIGKKARALHMESLKRKDGTTAMQNVAALGLKPGTQPYYDELRKQMNKKGGVTVNNKMPEGKKYVSSGDASKMMDSKGRPVRIPAGMTYDEAKDKGYTYGYQPTAEEAKTTASSETSIKMADELLSMVDNGLDISGFKGWGEVQRSGAGLENIFLDKVMNGLGYEIDPKSARAIALSENLSNTVLQALRGAAVGPAEQDRVDKQLPRPGQPMEVYKQNIILTIENLKRINKSKAESRGLAAPAETETDTSGWSIVK